MQTNILTQQTAATQYVEADGIQYAYRRFGNPSGVPLLFLQHFVGNIDDWDPAITNEMAKTREIILFNNRGVASTSGKTPDNVADMATDALSFIKALNLNQVDLLGYSLGGFLAQQMAITQPELIRKVLLVGTAPQGGFSSFLDFVEEMKKREGAELFLFTFFTPTELSRAKGMESLQRIYAPDNRKDSEVSNETTQAQAIALHRWGTMEATLDLKQIKQPTLIINGSDDAMLHTQNSNTLFQEIPNSDLILYADSAHGSLFQYPEKFIAHSNYFLDKN